MLVTWVDHDKSEEIQTPHGRDPFYISTVDFEVFDWDGWLTFSGYDHIFTLGWVE